MADIANRSYLRLCVAKICQDVGFNSIQSTPLEVLTDLLQDYVMALAKTAYNYALHCGNTEPNLNHLALAFKDMGVSITELKEYVRYVDSSAVFDCPKYPISKESRLNLLKPGSREVVTRPVHIHEHLPPMHPHLEDLELGIKQDPNTESSTPESSPVNTSKSKTFKRPGDTTLEGSIKRSRFVCEEEGRPLRELSSVVMTTSGFLSPAREGKLPEARTPIVRPDLLNQESDSSSNPGSNSTDPKAKKKPKVPFEDKKLDKETKALPEKEEQPVEKEEEEVAKQKRPNGGKDTVKKIKTSSGKNIPSTSNNNGSVKPHKQSNKLKNSSTSNSPLGFLNKSIKVKSPKSDKLLPGCSKDASISSLIQPSSDYKISSEPDKQKLNIFKKISKIKDEPADDGDEKPNFESSSLSRVDVTIESVIKQMVNVDTPMHDLDTKDEVVDIETVHSPNPYETLLTIKNEDPSDNVHNIPLLTPPLIIKPEKKKKKIRKPKKEHFPDLDINVVKPTRTFADAAQMDEIMGEIVDVNLPPQEPPPPIEIIPERIPSPEPVPFIVHTPPRPQPPNTQPDPIQMPITPPIQNPSTSEPNDVSSPPASLNEESALEIVSKKKIHKKEKKDKLKKKKKDKIKNKEKSEKRKLKLEKKNKDKEKQRIKKEKKEKRKEKEAEEMKPESTSSVPKITLKIGPPVSPSSSADSNARKIVIIPVVKKDKEEGSRAERAPSPELARFSPLVPNPKQKPNKSAASEEVKVTTEPKITTKINTKLTTTTVPTDLIDSSTLPPSVKLDKHGNKVWICPACGRRDDGSPMIGCDGCDAWYHWVCVGIQVPPEVKKWFCNACLSKKKSSDPDKKKKKKKNLNKKSKET